MIKLALIGCGRWGKNYLKNLTSIGGCELSWVCDLDAQKLNEVAVNFPNLKCTQNVTDILEDNQIQGVVIATPPQSHYSLAKQFLTNAKNILVEKPVTINSNESFELINLSSEKNLILMAGYMLIYHPAILKIKEHLKNDKGDIHYLNMSRTNSYSHVSGVDVLHDLAVHDIYLSCYLLGEEPSWVIARSGNYGAKGNNDVVYILLGFPKGQIVSIFSSFIHNQKTREMTLVSSKTKLLFNDVLPIGEKIRIFANGESQEILKIEETTEPLKLECMHFVECIKDNKQPQSGKAAISTVARLTDCIVKSLTKGGEKVFITEGSSTK